MSFASCPTTVTIHKSRFPDSSNELSTRKVNVVKIEITVDGFPFIAVLSAVDLTSMQELSVDETVSYWKVTVRSLKKARSHLILTQQFNKLLDNVESQQRKINSLEDDRITKKSRCYCHTTQKRCSTVPQ